VPTGEPTATAGATRPVPDWVRELSADLDLDALCEIVVRRDLAAAFPEHLDDPTFVERLRASVRENLRTLQAVLCGERELTDIRLEEPLAFGEAQAYLGIPQTALQKSYRVGFVAMWEVWMSALMDRVAEAGIDATEALEASAALVTTIFAYQDHVASLVAGTHARTDEALHRSRGHLRQRLVRDLLRADADALSPSELMSIGYAFDHHHLAVLLPELAVGAAEQLAAGLRAATGVRQTLVYPLGLNSTVIWLGLADGWPATRRAELERVLTTVDLIASVSDAGPGLDGFRRCLDQVRDVERIRRAWGAGAAPRLMTHADVALESLLLQDVEAARRFVRAELRTLAGDRPEDVRLRATLEASFQCGSHVGTADRLRVHEHTVRNRLQKVEDALGPGWTERSTEVQVALRLHRLVFTM
jgi:hypothetical protein